MEIKNNIKHIYVLMEDNCKSKSYTYFVIQKKYRELLNSCGIVPKIRNVKTDAIKNLNIIEILKEIKNNSILLIHGEKLLNKVLNRNNINNWRGSVFRNIFDGKNIFIIPTYNNEDVSLFSNKYDLFFLDISKVIKIYRNTFPLIELKNDNFIIDPSVSQVIDYFNDYSKCEPKRLAFDIETIGDLLNCISFAYDNKTICIPFLNAKSNNKVRNLSIIKTILENENIPKVGQNIFYDINFLYRNYDIKTRSNSLDDTMFAHHMLYPELKKGLDIIASIYTDIPFYKNEGKEYLQAGNKLWYYNCYDSLACIHSINKQIKLMKERGVYFYYKEFVKNIFSLSFSHYNNILDINMIANYKDNMLKNIIKDIVTLKSNFKEKTDKLNYKIDNNFFDSHKEKKKFFYKFLKIKPYVLRGKPTINTNALKKLTNKDKTKPFAKILLEIKDLNSEFKKIEKLEDDYITKMETAFNLIGTKCGGIKSNIELPYDYIRADKIHRITINHRIIIKEVSDYPTFKESFYSFYSKNGFVKNLTGRRIFMHKNNVIITRKYIIDYFERMVYLTSIYDTQRYIINYLSKQDNIDIISIDNTEEKNLKECKNFILFKIKDKEDALHVVEKIKEYVKSKIVLNSLTIGLYNEERDK